MAENGKRDWVDTAAKLLVPLVIFGVGFQYSCQKDRTDRARQQFDRDATYVKSSASDNEREKEVTLAIINALVEQNEFTPALRSAVAVIATGKRDEASTQTAQLILNHAAEKNPTLGAQIKQAAQAIPLRVYIQVTTPDQRTRAEELRAELRAEGFVAPGTELRADESPNNTEIRYFAESDKPQVDQVAAIMKRAGYAPTVKNTSAAVPGKVPLRQIEVWIGKRQN
jgi:hypothetical protein